MGTADSVRAIVKCRRHVNTDPDVAWQGSECRFPLTLAIDEGGAVRTRAAGAGALTPRQRPWAGSMSLKCHGPARYWALGDLGPVPRVAKVDSVGRTQVDPVLDGVVVERERLVQVVGDLRGGLRELGAVAASKALTAARAWSFSSAPQISAWAFFAPGCADFGSAAAHWRSCGTCSETPWNHLSR